MRWRNSHLLAMFIFVVEVSSTAADVCAPRDSTLSAPRLGVDVIRLTGVNAGRTPMTASSMAASAGRWNVACNVYHNPAIRSSGSGDMTVQVRFYSGTDQDNGFNCNGSCGCTSIITNGGVLQSATIHMFERQQNTFDCTNSAHQINVLTHEIGHVLGLDNSSCSNRIMGNVQAPIVGADCAAVDVNFMTLEEQQPDEDGDLFPCE